jgi:hypothetical protein
VSKVRIVEYDWHNWDLNAEEPEEYPDEGEPEVYILARRHSEKLATEIGDIWEVVLRQGAHVDLVNKDDPYPEIRIIGSTWNGDQFFLAKDADIPGDFGMYPVVTDTGKTWLEQHAGDWVRFEDVGIR